MFAPRRTGKTEFLTKDFTPYAESKGHKVVYMSFWRAPLSPLALILRSLEDYVKIKNSHGTYQQCGSHVETEAEILHARLLKPRRKQK